MSDDEDKDSKASTAIAVAKELAAPITKLYEDLLSRPLQAVASVASPPVEWLGRGLQRIFGPTPPKNLQSPPAHIMGPVALGFVFSQDSDELRSMYAKLLASSMDGDRPAPHPSFAEFIRQMDPIEARLFRELCRLGYGVVEQLREGELGPLNWETVDVVVEVQGHRHVLGGSRWGNLHRLGLVTRVDGWLQGVPTGLPEFEHRRESLRRTIPADVIVTALASWRADVLLVTPLGQEFHDACVPGEEWTW